MRNKLKIVTVVIIFGFLSFMILTIYIQIRRNEQIAEQIRYIPEFYFYQLGTDSIFTDADITSGKATLLIYFHPDCEHCQFEADIIGKRINDFIPFQLLFISYDRAEQIKTFADHYKLTGFANIIFLEDKDLIFNDVFGESVIPESLIYDKNGNFVKKFRGEVKVDALLKYLKGAETK